MLMLVAFITEGGRLFQAVVTLSEKACFRIFFWALWANNLSICPVFPTLIKIGQWYTIEIPLKIPFNTIQWYLLVIRPTVF